MKEGGNFILTVFKKLAQENVTGTVNSMSSHRCRFNYYFNKKTCAYAQHIYIHFQLMNSVYN